MHRIRLAYFRWLLLVLWTTSLSAEPTAILSPSQVIQPERGEHPVKPPVITALAVRPGGGMVATAGDDHAVRLWSTSTGRVVQTLQRHGDWVRTLAFSPDGQSLASAGDDRQIMVWQVSTGKQTTRVGKQPSAVYSLAYSPDSRLLAAVGFEQHVRVYDAQAGQQVRELAGPGRDLRSVAFSPDGSRLAVAAPNGRIRIWDQSSDKAEVEIAAAGHRIRTLAYLPGGDKLVSAGDGRAIFIWDAHSGQEVYKFECPTGKVLSMAVCGESLIATGGSDNLVRVWNWQTQTQQDQLRGHTGSVASLAYDSASGVIISGSYDTTVRVWRIGAEKPGQDTATPNKLESRVR